MRLIYVAVGLLCLSACVDPYERRDGEFNAGPVDPVSFPPAYLGTDGNRQQQGKGKFTALTAYVQGSSVKYFSFPFTAGQLRTPQSATTPEALRLTEDGKPTS